MELKFNRAASSLWRILIATGMLVFAYELLAQPFLPGVTYFGRSNYIQYAAGDLPFILSAPHGGTLTPSEIPNRTNCASCPGWDFTTTTDTATDDVANRVRTAVANLTGHLPHIIICRLDRDKIDCNRPIDEGAQGNAAAVTAWNEFQNYIDASSNAVIGTFGRGFYIDQHGQGHPEQRLELGYLLDKYDLTNSNTQLDSVSSYRNSSSIRTLANSIASSNTFSQLLRGTNSFGAWMVSEGYPSTPSYTIPAPFANPAASSNFFDGGYNTQVHGSDGGGPLSALQIEANYDGVRDFASNRIAYSQALARVMEKFFARYYGISLRMCAPSVWSGGGGNWSSTNNWALGILPVSSNLLFFAGSGGSVNHDLASLSAGSGFVSALVFSNTAGGPYTLSGNSIALNGGLTSSNPFTNTVNNNLTLPNTCPIAVIGALNLNGILSGDGFAKSGAGKAVLTGANSYSGGTLVSDGTLLVNNTIGSGTGNGAVTVVAPGILGGKGTIAGSVSCTGTISAGQGVGKLTIGSGLDLSGGGTNIWSLYALSESGDGTNFDQIVVTGGVLALGVTSRLQLNFTNSAVAPTNASPFWMTSHTWKIISLTGSAVNGAASSFPVILNGTYSTGRFTNRTDGAGVLLSYIANSAARPLVQSFEPASIGMFKLIALSETNRAYVLETAPDLSGGNWTPISTNIAAGSQLMLTNIPANGSMRFYRLLVVP